MTEEKLNEIEEEIKKYINSQPEPKRSDLQALHQRTLQVSPACKLWLNDGKNSEGKTIANHQKAAQGVCKRSANRRCC